MSGSNVQIMPIVAFPTSLAASAVWQSGMCKLPGPGIIFCATLTQIGTITLQRFLDRAGTMPVDLVALSQTLSANTAATVAVNDGQPALYFQATLTNTGGSTATVSGTALACNLAGA